MMKRLLQRGRKQDGFTLIELIVVVAILGILAAVVTPRVLDAIDNAKTNSALAFGKEIQLAMERIYVEDGEYPTNDEIKEPAEVDEIAEFAALMSKYVTVDSANITNVVYDSPATDKYTLELTLKDTGKTVAVTPESVTLQ